MDENGIYQKHKRVFTMTHNYLYYRKIIMQSIKTIACIHIHSILKNKQKCAQTHPLWLPTIIFIAKQPQRRFPKKCRSHDTQQLIMPNVYPKYITLLSHFQARTRIFTEKPPLKICYFRFAYILSEKKVRYIFSY